MLTAPPPTGPAAQTEPPTGRHRSAGPTPPPPPPPTAAPTARQRTPRETQHARHGAGPRSRRTTATGEPKRDADETNDGGSSGHRLVLRAQRAPQGGQATGGVVPEPAVPQRLRRA